MDDDESDGAPGTSRAAPTRPDSAAEPRPQDVEFALFYESGFVPLVAFLTVQGAKPWVATDIAQEAMIEAYRKWDTIDSPRSWIRTVASRKWWRRSERNEQEVSIDEAPESHPLLSQQASAEIEVGHTFLTMVRDLPVAQRQVLAWTYDGYQPTEIAALLNKDPATIRSTLRDARAAMRKRPWPEQETP
jgi:RNA polymerase sigma-70 factor (ECF subfamily)